MMTFFDMLPSVVLFLAGFGLMCIIIYALIKNRKLKKYGVPVKVIVKDVKENLRESEDRKVIAGYYITYQFIYQGEQKEMSYFRQDALKVGRELHGIYVPDKKKPFLSVAGSGYHLEKGGTLFVGSFALYLIVVALLLLQEDSTGLIALVSFIYIPVIAIAIVIYQSLLEKNKVKTDIPYQEIIANDGSNISGNWIEVEEKDDQDDMQETEKEKRKGIVDWIMSHLLSLIFGFNGIVLLVVVAIALYTDISLTLKGKYQDALCKIQSIYTYESEISDGEYEEMQGIVCKYEIGEKSYTKRIDTGKKAEDEKYSVGDTVDLRYRKGYPENAGIKSSLFENIVVVFACLMIGIIFVFIAVHNWDDSKKKKFMKEY